MKTNKFSLWTCWTLGFLLAGMFVQDVAWSQGPRDRGNRGRRGDPASFLLALQDRRFAPTLKLTKDQEEQMRKLGAESFGLWQKGLSREDFAQAAKEIEEKAVNVLDDNQKAIWEKRKQEILADVAKSDSSSNDRPPRGDDRPSRSDSNSSAGVLKAAEAPAPVRGTIPDDKPPEGEIAVISFGPNAVAKNDKAYDDSEENPAAVAPTQKVEAKADQKEEQKLRFSFRYAPWADVLKLFAEVNDLSLDLNDVPPGTFNYIDDRNYTMTQALDVLNGYLLSKGYILVRRDRFLVCWNIADGPVPPNLIPNITEDDLPSRGRNELLSLVLPLKGGLDAEKMATEVTPLLGPQGKATAMKSTNSLILTDIGDNLRRVHKLLNAGVFTAPAGENSFRAIPLKHITAVEAERVVRKHFGLNPAITTNQPGGFRGFGPGGFGGFGNGGFGGFGGGFNGGGGGRGDRGDGGGGGPQGGGQPGQGIPGGGGGTGNNPPSPFAGKIQVTADPRLNVLIVTANTTLIKLVEDIVKSLDTIPEGNVNAVEQEPPFYQAYSIPGSDTASMAQMLNNMIPGVVMGYDARAGKVFIQGTKKEHAEIARLIKSSSSPTGDSVAVITLQRLDPIQVTNSIRSLFAQEGTRAPSVEADPNGRRILVRGTPDQLAQVKALLRDMGETSAGAGMESGVAEDRGNVRRLQLGSLDPEEVLGLVQRTWAATGRSPIRVVIPSRSNPVREGIIPRATLPNLDPDRSELEQPQPPRQNPVKTRTEPTKGGQSTPVIIRQKQPQSSENSASSIPEPKKELETARSGLVVSTTGRPKDSNKTARTTQLYPRRLSVLPASQRQSEEAVVEEVAERPDADEPPSAANPDKPAEQPDEPTDENANAKQPVTSSDEQQPEGTNKPKAKKSSSGEKTDSPMAITVLGNELIIEGADKEKLDELEDMLSTLISAIPQRTRWTVFYLRSADATETAQMLERLFPQSSVTTTPLGNDGLFGSLTSGLSTFGRGMMNATGLNQTLGAAQNLRIITDVRSNALFVAGPPDVIRDVEYMLELLDSSELPGTMRDRLPRSIPVEYADIDEVADIIESVFKDQMTAEQAQQGPQGFNPLAAMFGGGRGGGQGQQRKPAAAELSLGIDRRTSNLIVQCNETMFQRIETMVKAIDQRAKDANRTVRVVALQTADPLMVQTTLTSLIPKVTVSGIRPRPRRRPPQDGSPQQPGGAQPQNGAPDATRDQQVIQRMMEQNGQSNGMSTPNFGRQGGGMGNGFQGGNRFNGGGRGGRGRGGN